MVWHPANVIERAMAWALATGNYARYFTAFTGADLYLPRRAGDDPDGYGEPVTAELAGRTVLPVFTSDEGLLAAYADQLPDLIVVVSYEDLRDDWPSPQWRLAINPGSPIEAYLPVDLVDPGARGELGPGDPDVLIWQPGQGESGGPGRPAAPTRRCSTRWSTATARSTSTRCATAW
jgi:hypothetical protein